MGDKVKVLSVCTSDSHGGAGRAAYRIHLAVQEYGIESQMFVKHKGTKDGKVIPVSDFIPSNAYFRAFEWMRDKVRNRWQHHQWGKYPTRSRYFMSDLRSMDICGALNKIDYDILHLHWVNLRFLPLDRLPKDKPIVWTLHDSWPFCGVCHLPMDCRGYQRECGSCPELGSERFNDLSHQVWAKKHSIYKNLDLHIVAPSRWMAGCAHNSALFGNIDIRVIPNCLEMDTFCPGDRMEACQRFNLDPAKRHILFGAVNAIEDKNKGFKYLVEALKRVGTGFDEEIDLVVFGSTHRIADEIGGIRVHSVGLLKHKSDIVSIYRAADLTVVPSMSENLSCTVMESMACGSPVVAFDVGGNGDLIDHQVNGYLAREKDSVDLANGIIWCLDNAHGMAESARRKVMDNFTPSIVGNQYAKLYRTLKES